MKLLKVGVFSLTCVGMYFASVSAFGAPIIYNFDENCHGVSNIGVMDCQLFKDPISGMTTTVFSLPGSLIGGLVSGDFRVLESLAVGDISDVLRFNSNTHSLYVFSDTDDSPLAMADVGLPVSVPGFQDLETQLAPGIFGVSYTPTNNTFPGFIAGGVTYNFVSDGNVVPEPKTVLLMALPLTAMMLLRRRRPRV